MKKYALLILLWIILLDIDFTCLVYGNKILKITAIIALIAIVSFMIYLVVKK